MTVECEGMYRSPSVKVTDVGLMIHISFIVIEFGNVSLLSIRDLYLTCLFVSVSEKNWILTSVAVGSILPRK